MVSPDPAADKLEAARIHILNSWPYYSHILFMLQPVYGGTDNLSVDQHLRLYLDREWVEQTETWQIIWLLLHQINHVVRDHAQRGIAREQVNWNVAADLEINSDMSRTSKVQPPEGALMPEQFGFPDGEIAETYYGWLSDAGDKAADLARQAESAFMPKDPSNKKMESGKGQQNDEPESAGSEQNSNNSDGDAPKEGETSDTGNLDNTSESDDQGSSSQNDQTSGASNQPDVSSAAPTANGQPGAPSAGRCGCVAGGGNPDQQPPEAELSGTDIGGYEPEAVQRARERAITALDEYAQQNGIGSIPAGLLRVIEKARRPQANWQNLLRRYILKARNETRGQVNYSWRRPNRRQGRIRTGDPVLPATMRPVPNIGLVIDTSGSMTRKDLADCLAEAAGIIAAAGQVVAVACDYAAYNPTKVVSAPHIKLEGGGGTDMRIGIDAAIRATPKPDVIVVLTDGYTPWPDKRSPVPLVVGLVGKDSATESSVPEWAATVPIRPE